MKGRMMMQESAGKTEEGNTSRQGNWASLMTEGSIWVRILIFSIPLILGNLLQQMYNAADSVIVGNYVGSNALAAVGASTVLINLLISFSQGAAAGTGVVVAQYLGAGKRAHVQYGVHTAFTIAILLGLILSVAGIAFSSQMLIWMRTPKEVLGDAAVYLRIYSAGILFNVLYNMCTGIMNAVGDSRRPLIYLAAAAMTNVVLDLVLICGFKMGVAGAAIATSISQGVSCVLAAAFLMRVQADYRICLNRLRIQRTMARQIIQIGLPAGIQNMVISLANVLVQSGVNSFGPKVMAGFGAYMKIDGFNILPVTSFSMAVTTFVGQNFGAGKLGRVKQGVRVTLVMSLLYTLVTGAILLLCSRQVIGLFTADSEVIRYGTEVMKYFCPFYFLLGILHSLAGAVRGTGKTVPSMVILLISMCLFRILWVQTVVPFYGTVQSLYVVYPVSWLLGAALMALYAWRARWLE